MNARVIIAGNNRAFPADAAQSCAAYLNKMSRPSPPCGLEAAARSVVLPEDERAASFAYDLTAGRWIVPPPSLAKRDAGASAEPMQFLEPCHTQRSHTQTHTDSRRPARGSNHTAGLISAAVEIATVVGGMAAFSAIAFVMLVLA